MSVATLYPTAREALAAATQTAVAPLAFRPAAHLLNRFSFGATGADRTDPLTADPDAWWTNQVGIGRAAPGYAANPAVAAIGPMLAMTPATVQAQLTSLGRAYGWDALDQLNRVTLGLQIWSPAQLYETVVDFFANHLNILCYDGDVWNTRHVFDRDVIRANAFGTFSDMLVASAKSSAMLYYLNQAESNKTAVNENYGRELLELHTVGLNYTESDVKNSAAIMTGRTVNGTDWTYQYKPSNHALGTVTVLGFTDPNTSATNGDQLADNYVRYLAHHPLTASRLAQKLCVRYVSDTPSTSLVAQVAAVYLANDTAILPTINAILRSDEFWASRGAKTRRPAENAIAAVRAIGAQASGDIRAALDPLRWYIYLMGNDPLGYAPPPGYPDRAANWRSAGNLILTWNVHRALVQTWWTTWSAVNTTALLGSTPPATSGAAIDLLAARLVGQPLSSTDRQTLLTYLGESAATPYATSKAKSMLAGLVILLLDSPYHALR
jgi:uncharacterized protein (DUF1800 family)